MAHTIAAGDENHRGWANLRHEQRIVDQAYRAWFVRDIEPLPVLVTTTSRIWQHREGILGPIWRSPAADGRTAEGVYWLPDGPPGGLRRAGIGVSSPRLVWPTARDAQVVNRRAALRAQDYIA